MLIWKKDELPSSKISLQIFGYSRRQLPDYLLPKKRLRAKITSRYQDFPYEVLIYVDSR